MHETTKKACLVMVISGLISSNSYYVEPMDGFIRRRLIIFRKPCVSRGAGERSRHSGEVRLLLKLEAENRVERKVLFEVD